ncbi:XdhC family protein [Methylobacter sp. Wu1]|uniref:XdhC family protein n=1 Tax=Methylobacter sp. Wu1 TaxID=3119359 RepID=UPI002F92C0FC
MANKINHLINAYRQLKQQAEDCVLATIIETFGSTYQKAGARMLITKQGKLIGLLGGGCFERDLIEQALSVFETGEAKAVFYDMRSPDDVVWGLGLGCNGAVRVLLQLLKAEEDFRPLNVIADAAEANLAGVLVTVYESGHPDFPVGHHFLLLRSVKRQLLTTTPFPFTAPTLQTLLQQKSRIESHVINNQAVGAFYDPLQPPLQLLVLGAGADAIPLVQLAKSLGWRVTVVDHRPGHIKKERFPQADRLLHLMPQDLNSSLELNRFNALVLMTHNIEYDERYLKSIMFSHIPFIGLLGPSHRKDRLLQSLGSDASRISNRVFGPVGLDIGAETPEEIALSIMAGIHAELNGRSGQPLSLKAASDLHECIH